MGCILNMNIMSFKVNGDEQRALEVMADAPVRGYKQFKSSRYGVHIKLEGQDQVLGVGADDEPDVKDWLQKYPRYTHDNKFSNVSDISDPN